MNLTDFRYVEIVQNGAHNRGYVTELPNDKSNIDLNYYGKYTTDAFHSAYLQTVDYQKYDDGSGGKRGYSGPVFSHALFWDLDNDDLQLAQKDAIELVERLFAYHKGNTRIYFSGSKGFHILYVCPELCDFVAYPDFSLLVKKVCTEFALGLKCFDASIYDKTRIIRTPNSLNSKSGRYKIPLSYEELKLWSIEHIMEHAAQQRQLKYDSVPQRDETVLDIITRKSKDTTETRQSLYTGNDLIDGIRYGFQEGDRNNGLASLAGLLHSRNITGDLLLALCENINNTSNNPLSPVEVERIVGSISRYPVDSAYVKPTAKDIYTFKDGMEKFISLMSVSGDFSFGERYPHLNKVMKTTLLGDVIGLVSDSGVGKSTIALDLGNSFAQFKYKYTLFVSLEMAAHACVFRGATITATPDEYGDISSSFVAAQIMNNEEFRDGICREWQRTLISDKDGLGLEDIEAIATMANEQYEGQLGMIVIDYAQYIDGASNIEKAIPLYREIKQMMKRLKMVCLLLLQTNKSIPNKFTEVEDTHIEGTKSLKQTCDFLLAVWKSIDDDKRLHGKFLKTRWEKDGAKFDLVRSGLKYHSEDYVPDRQSYGGL